MKFSLRVLFSFFIFISFATFLVANDLNTTSNIKAKVLYAKYINPPKIVYTKQRFTLDININILLPKEQDFSISTDIGNGLNIEKITEDISWIKTSEHTYSTKLIYKVKNGKFILPNVNITISDINNTYIDNFILQKPKITYRNIAINQKRYSNVIASFLEVSSVTTKQYTNDELLSVLVINAKNSNLEEFYLSSYETQKIVDISWDEDIQTLYYSVILPKHEKYIYFEYYNSIEDKFILIKTAVNLKEDLVSTQTDLNPYENDMIYYKKITLGVIVLFFMMIYYFRRKFKYLFIGILFMTFFIILMIPNQRMIVEENTKVYILPTKNSTIYKIVDEQQEVEILIQNDNFLKILFKNGNLGWIKK